MQGEPYLWIHVPLIEESKPVLHHVSQLHSQLIGDLVPKSAIQPIAIKTPGCKALASIYKYLIEQRDVPSFGHDGFIVQWNIDKQRVAQAENKWFILNESLFKSVAVSKVDSSDAMPQVNVLEWAMFNGVGLSITTWLKHEKGVTRQETDIGLCVMILEAGADDDVIHVTHQVVIAVLRVKLKPPCTFTKPGVEHVSLPTTSL